MYIRALCLYVYVYVRLRVFMYVYHAISHNYMHCRRHYMHNMHNIYIYIYMIQSAAMKQDLDFLNEDNAIFAKSHGRFELSDNILFQIFQ